jgi:hypothetical protein
MRFLVFFKTSIFSSGASPMVELTIMYPASNQVRTTLSMQCVDRLARPVGLYMWFWDNMAMQFPLYFGHCNLGRGFFILMTRSERLHYPFISLISEQSICVIPECSIVRAGALRSNRFGASSCPLSCPLQCLSKGIYITCCLVAW